MKKHNLLFWILSVVVHTLGVDAESCPDLPYPRPEPDYNGKLVRDFSPFTAALDAWDEDASMVVQGRTIPELQESMNASTLTSVDLVLYYLSRIQRYDVDKLNSVLELNPDAIAVAQQLDEERASGSVRGPLHGIPVLLKDNIATTSMHTAAGSAALLDWNPSRDAFLVQQLKAAGAIVLGKANLSEWANYMDPCMPSGFSTNGGQTRNPYGPFETWGSSSGSAVSVAADLVTVSVGSETQGSIIMPGSINSVVALKTSRGMVSGDHIIPLLPWQDVAGPMGRTVTDVAVLLGAMTGVDENDPNTQASMAGVDFTQFLTTTTTGTPIRVGIEIWTETAIREFFAALNVSLSEEDAPAVFESYEALNAEARATGELLSSSSNNMVIKEIPANQMPEGYIDLDPALEYGFGQALNEFLSALGEEAPFASLEEIIDYNKQDLANRAPYGQAYLEGSANTNVSSAEYDQIRQENQAQAREQLDALFEGQEIDVVVSSVGQKYAPAGYPALTVPSGYDPTTGGPQAIVFVGGFLSEPQLLAVGYAYEQASLARVAPDLEAEPWLPNPCSPCQVIGVCFLEEACSLRDSSTGIWSGEAAECNEVAPACEECFPDAPCYLGGNATVTKVDIDTSNGDSESSNNEQDGTGAPSGSTRILSKCGMHVVVWMAAILLHENIL